MQAKNIIDKKDNSNIIDLGRIAKLEKEKDKTVINSTTGMLYGENGRLFTYKSVDEAIGMLSPEEKYAYFPTGGNDIFREKISSWVFGKYYEEFKPYVKGLPTPGGTGALSNSFSNFLNDNDICLLPNYMWTNYKQILFEENKKYDTYNLYNENGSFDLDDLKAKALNIINKNKRVMLLINDPAENPTGYSLKPYEIEKLVKMLNELSKYGEVILTVDLAYLDYADSYNITRDNLSKFLDINEEVLINFCFSASKSFGLYGMRVGSQIIYTKNKVVLNKAFDSNVFSSRAKWSNTSSIGINLIIKILSDKELMGKYLKELNDSREMLKNRAILFLTECKRLNIDILPYEAGYFVSIKSSNPKELYEKLRVHKLHIVPFDNLIRITLASITLDEVKRIPEILKKVI